MQVDEREIPRLTDDGDVGATDSIDSLASDSESASGPFFDVRRPMKPSNLRPFVSDTGDCPSD